MNKQRAIEILNDEIKSKEEEIAQEKKRNIEIDGEISAGTQRWITYIQTRIGELREIITLISSAQ